MEEDEFTRKHIELESRYHYLILREKDASKRQRIYAQAYQEYYELFNKHRSHIRTFGYKLKLSYVYKRFMKDKVVLDIGCGYGFSTFDFSRHAKKVYGAEIVDHLIEKARSTAKKEGHKNVEFIKLEGIKLPFPDNSMDTVYSNDLVEHFHEDDLKEHLSEVYRVLRKGGVYIAITPNRIFGPHDITVKRVGRGNPSEGFHIHEFTYDELISVFGEHGFGEFKTPLINEYILKNLWFMPFIGYLFVPPGYKKILERLFLFRMRTFGFLAGIFNVSLIGKK